MKLHCASQFRTDSKMAPTSAEKAIREVQDNAFQQVHATAHVKHSGDGSESRLAVTTRTAISRRIALSARTGKNERQRRSSDGVQLLFYSYPEAGAIGIVSI